MEQERLTKKKRFDKKLLFLPGAALVVAGVVLGLLFILNGDGEEHTVYDSDAFFLRETSSTSSNYALFNKNGDKKTDFIFKSVSAFVDGYALVRNSDNKYGIINQDGNMTVDFGVHEDLETRGGLYEATDGNKHTIIKGNGDLVVEDYIYAFEASGAPYLAVETEAQKYSIYNATGGKLLEFSSPLRPVFNTFNKKVATSLSYNGHLVLLNNKTLGKIKEQETDVAYRLSATSEDMKTFVLRGAEGDKSIYAVLHDGKFREYGDECSAILLTDSTSSIKDRKYLTCTKGDGVYLMRGLDVTDININDEKNRVVVFDEKHYARYDSADKKVSIFVDNSEKLSVSADTLPVIRSRGYFVVSNAEKHSRLYDLDGKQLFELNTNRGSLNGLDDNERIIVNDPTAQSINEYYYLADKDGKAISKKYSSITRHGEYYAATDAVNKSADLLNKNGEVVISGDYTAFKFYRDGKLVFGQTDTDKYDLIDVKGKSVKQSLAGQLSVGQDEYFSIKTDNETVYYTIKGKEFYRQAK